MIQRERVELDHLVVDIHQEPGRSTYIFRGSIDERFQFRKIPVHTAAEVNFNLRDLKTLNSCGVREWVYFVRQFEGKARFTLSEVAVAFIDQVNIIPQMLGRAQVESFLAPFYCPKCDEEVNELLVCQDHREALLARRAPKVLHGKCGGPLEFDALEESYFHQVERFIG